MHIYLPPCCVLKCPSTACLKALGTAADRKNPRPEPCKKAQRDPDGPAMLSYLQVFFCLTTKTPYCRFQISHMQCENLTSPLPLPCWNICIFWQQPSARHEGMPSMEVHRGGEKGHVNYETTCMQASFSLFPLMLLLMKSKYAPP